MGAIEEFVAARPPDREPARPEIAVSLTLTTPGSVGRSTLGIAHICDERGSELPWVKTGLVYFERDVLPFAYRNNPGRTRQALHPDHDNWGTTGDIGYLEEDGFLFLTDRQSFMIISGGVNIYPQGVLLQLAVGRLIERYTHAPNRECDGRRG